MAEKSQGFCFCSKYLAKIHRSDVKNTNMTSNYFLEDVLYFYLKINHVCKTIFRIGIVCDPQIQVSKITSC